MLIYDRCDSLEMPSRNKMALRRMQEAETRLLADADLVTYSARSMESGLRTVYARDLLFLPNAVEESMVGSLPASPRTTKQRVIGYVGSADERWLDRSLLLQVAEHFPECKVRLRLSPDRRFATQLRRYPNVHIIPFLRRAQLRPVLAEFDVGLLPFKRNDIADQVNPLKMYEYAAAGVPMVGTKTTELEHYADLVHLAHSPEEFLELIKRSIHSDHEERRAERLRFARENTWRQRVDTLLRAIQ